MPNLQQDSLRLGERGSAANRFFGLCPVTFNCPSPTVFGSLFLSFFVDRRNLNKVLDQAVVLNDEIESSHPSVWKITPAEVKRSSFPRHVLRPTPAMCSQKCLTPRERDVKLLPKGWDLGISS